MFAYLESALVSYIHTLPLEIFVPVASFIEEVIAPIPSPTVMMLSGSVAAMQGYLVPSLILLAVFGAFGKTLGAVIIYTIADKAEDIIIQRFGGFFGVTREDIESFGKKLQGGVRDYVVMTILRALPIVPSSVVSVGSGILEIPMRVYIVSTFLGTMLRDGVYLYIGYLGTDIFKRLIDRSSHIESYIEAAVLVGLVSLLIYLYVRRKRMG